MLAPAVKLLFILSLALPVAVHAEVFKCVSTKGSVTYSDDPCGPQSKVLKNMEANTIPAIPVERPLEVMAQPLVVARPNPVFDGQPPFMPHQGDCDRTRRNADTAASSSTSTQARRDLAEREINIVCFGPAAAAAIEQAKAAAPKVIVRQDRNYFRRCLNGYCIDTDTPVFLVPRNYR